MKKIAIVTCGLVLNSIILLGNEDISSVKSLDSAFKNGKIEGSLTLYGKDIENDKKVEYKEGKFSKKVGYLNGNAVLSYETASFYGFSAKAEFKGNIDLGEVHNGDRKNNAKTPYENSALLTQGYLKYDIEDFYVIAGRQEVELEWLRDYHEGVFSGISFIPNTSIVLGWTKRKSESTVRMSEDFWEMNENKGVYVADIKNNSLEFVEINPYFYEAPNLANWYGLKTTFINEYFNLAAQYVQGNSDKKTDLKDESLAQIELNTNIGDLTILAGYIKTDKQGGAVTIATGGDNSSFEDKNYIFDINARTRYGGLGYSISNISFDVLYGHTKYGEENFTEKELNFRVEYAINDSFNTSFLYVNVNTNNSGDTDYDKYIAAITYNF